LPATFNPSFAALVAGVAAATVIDIRTRRIPNELTASLATIGIGLAAMGMSGLSVWMSLAGLAVGLALMMPGHLIGATGAGDVKLMAAVGAVLGPATVVTAFLLTAVAGGVLAVAVALRRRRLTATLEGTKRLIQAPSEAPNEISAAPASHRFAYGPAIAIGSVLAGLIG
jgi:prepilin peptidase CpaA